MLIAILVVFIICWTPRVMMSFSVGLLQWSGLPESKFALSKENVVRLRDALKMFSYVNSIVNVVIYYITSK